MSDPANSCAVCDTRIDPYGRDGTRCARCSQPCPTCQGDVAYCAHPLIVRVEFKTLANGRERIGL